MRNRLTQEKIVEAAITLIEKTSIADFSMHALAKNLNIKTSSLYNHFDNMDSVMVMICSNILKMQRDIEMEAIKGKSKESAIFALANAYRKFAREHTNLYHFSIKISPLYGEKFNDISVYTIEPFMAILNNYSLQEYQKYHWQRILRGIIHGFVSQECDGFFCHLPVSVDESFEMAIKCYVDGLSQAEREEIK